MSEKENAEALYGMERARQGNPQVTLIRPNLEDALKRHSLWDDSRMQPMPKFPKIDARDIWVTR